MPGLKSIFGSKAEEAVFKSWLENADKINGHIFPQIALSAFIDFELIKDELNEREKDYFFKARVDFLICTKEFDPVLVVELDGYYHKYNKFYDQMKNNILKVADITIYRFDTGSIDNVKELFN